MAIVSYINSQERTGNFDEYVDGKIISSYKLNAEKPGVEVSELSEDVITTYEDFNANLYLIKKWIELVEITFNLPIELPDDRSSIEICSSKICDGAFEVNGYAYGLNFEYATKVMIIRARKANFFTWGEFLIFQRNYRDLIEHALGKEII